MRRSEADIRCARSPTGPYRGRRYVACYPRRLGVRDDRVPHGEPISKVIVSARESSAGQTSSLIFDSGGDFRFEWRLARMLGVDGRCAGNPPPLLVPITFVDCRSYG